MSDVFSRSKRSEIMSKIRGSSNKTTELLLIKILRKRKITGWRRNIKIFGKPDFVFQREKVAIFVDGCFWHGCKIHKSRPRANKEFWANKLDGNIKRDRLVNKKLRNEGWTVVRIWEHAIKNNPEIVADKIAIKLTKSKSQ